MDEFFQEDVQELLIQLSIDCTEKGLWFNIKDLYWSLERDTQLSIPSSKMFIIDNEDIQLEYRLPWKFWVYRNYMGGGISGGIGKSEIKTGSTVFDEILDECQILFWTCLEQIEKMAFEPETERWADRFQSGMRIR